MAPNSTTTPGNQQKPMIVMRTVHKKKTTRPSPPQPQYIPPINLSTATTTTTSRNNAATTVPKCEHHHDHTSQVPQLKKEIQELKDQINILKQQTSSSIVPNEDNEDKTNHNNLLRIINEQKVELENLRGRNTILEDNQRVLEDLRNEVEHEKTKFEEFKANFGIQEKEKLEKIDKETQDLAVQNKALQDDKEKLDDQIESQKARVQELEKAPDYCQEQKLRLVGEKSECVVERDKIKAELENAKLEMIELTNSKKEVLGKAGDAKASQIATLEAELLKLHKENAKLEESCTIQEAAIEELLKENEALQQKIVKLANEVANLHQQLILVAPFASPATAVPFAPENENVNNDNYYKHSSHPNNVLDISSNTTSTNKVKLAPIFKPFPTPPRVLLEEDHCDEEDDYRPNLPQDCKSNHHQQEEPIKVLASEPQQPPPQGDLQEKISALEDQIRIIRQLLQSQKNNNNNNADDKSTVAAQPYQVKAKIPLPSCSKQTNRGQQTNRGRKRKIFKQEEDIGSDTSDHHSSSQSSRSSSSIGVSYTNSKNSSSRSRSSSTTSSDDDDYKSKKSGQRKRKKVNKNRKSGTIKRKHKRRDREKRRKLEEEEVKRIARQHLEFLQKTVAGGVRGVTNKDIQCRRCRVCKKKLSSKQYLILHIQSQHLSDERLPDEALKCQLCNHFFSNTSNLNAHVKQFHPNVNSVKDEGDK